MEIIQARTALFRNLVVSVVVLASIPIIWALVRLSLVPLGTLVLLVPLCGAFLYLDHRLVQDWRAQLLTMWAEGSLDLKLLTETIVQVRMLPPGMLRDMLDTLPKRLGPGRAPEGMRRAVTHTLRTLERCQGDRTAFVTAAYSLGLAALDSAAILRSWSPMLGLLLIPAIVGAGRWLEALRLRRWSRRMSETLQGHGREARAIVEALALLDWAPIPARKKARLLDSLAQFRT